MNPVLNNKLQLDTILQLENDEDFNRLHQQFHQFNPLKVLRVDQYEIRHSNVLAWLFDPNENHRLGSFFLRKVLMNLVTKSENEDKIDGIDYLPFLHAPLSDVVVHREWSTNGNGAIDLLIEIPSMNLILLIENKFHSAESNNQLDRYLTSVTERYSKWQVLPVFLTLSGEAPSHEAYWMLAYEDVLHIISQELSLNKETIADSIYDFLTYYIALLEERYVEDDEMMETAMKIYQNHAGAIHLICANAYANTQRQKQIELRDAVQALHGMTPNQREHLAKIYAKKQKTIDYVFKTGSNIMYQGFLSFVQEQQLAEGTYSPHARVPNFIPPAWVEPLSQMERLGKAYWLGYGLIVWFSREWNDDLKIHVEVGPLDYPVRLKLLQALSERGVTFRPSGMLEGKKYTKIHVATIPVSDWMNPMKVKEAMTSLVTSQSFKQLDMTVVDVLPTL
ncbi:PD-(D/E)XK nuclease family protein [Exiguobacterium algae]|uniref:PDDEXK-like family protein n=1 Tax=Exiguobacterium algae TaxID=2751250 RepID=UPI001BE91F53|nr:PD-(D/E)XK nuclease family protein [Exiguobacterium algae]